MTAAEYRERAAVYGQMLAAFEQQRDAHQREADNLNRDIAELRTYQANINALASLTEGQQRYRTRRRVG